MEVAQNHPFPSTMMFKRAMPWEYKEKLHLNLVLKIQFETPKKRLLWVVVGVAVDHIFSGAVLRSILRHHSVKSRPSLETWVENIEFMQ